VRHLEVERWHRQAGPLQGLDARAKLISVIIMLAFIGTARPWTASHALFYASLAVAAVIASRLPWAGVLRRLAVILPFSLTFALLSWISTGDPIRAAGLVSRSAVSCAFAVVLIGVTPVAALLDGIRSMGAPRMLMVVSQFLYRYLFVLFDQSMRVRQASACRGGFRWAAASGAAAALFASSQERAERIHWAMLARGFHGSIPSLNPPVWRASDTGLVAATATLLAGSRILWRL
jgi:cobalt/nickel transport system permease protein